MLDIDPKHADPREINRLLLGGVAPRPIALVSTISTDGVQNLSPFSFFNAFGANPPIVAFSPSRRGRDGTTKDTYDNLVATEECVVQAVTHGMVEQVSLASTEYLPGVDEFVKSGLTPVASDLVKPPRVKESPFQMECRLRQMINLGDGPGSGNLAVCEVIRFHVDQNVMRDDIIDPQLIDLAGRNSGNYYTRASGSAIFEVAKPVGKQGIGFDNLPAYLRQSKILSANNLARLANAESIPDTSDVMHFIKSQETAAFDMVTFDRHMKQGEYHEMLAQARTLAEMYHSKTQMYLEKTVKCALEAGDVAFAWYVAVYIGIRQQSDMSN